MTEKVSTFREVMLRGSPCILLLSKEQHDGTDLQRALNRFADQFGESAKLGARMIRSHPETRQQTFQDMINKAWPETIKENMRETERPFLLFIKNDFNTFDPENDDWRILWFSGMRSPRTTVKLFFDALLASINRGEDVFAFFNRLTRGRMLTIYGGVSSPDFATGVAEERRVGRPGIFGLESGLLERVNQGISCDIKNDRTRGWKSRIADELRRQIPEIAEYDRKSIVAALRKAGVFDTI